MSWEQVLLASWIGLCGGVALFFAVNALAPPQPPIRYYGEGFGRLAIPTDEATWMKADFLFRTSGSVPGTATPWVLSAWFKPKAASAAELNALVRGKGPFAPPITFGGGIRDYAVCQNVSGADYDAGITLAPWAHAEYCVQLVRTRRVTVDAEHDYRQDCGWSTWPDGVLRCEPPPPPPPEAGQNITLRAEVKREDQDREEGREDGQDEHEEVGEEGAGAQGLPAACHGG